MILTSKNVKKTREKKYTKMLMVVAPGYINCGGLLFSSLSFAMLKKITTGTSLVAQWLRIRLPMQGTRV